MCHYPIHGIRFFRGDDFLFGTSICWVCDNYYVEYPDDFESATWEGGLSKEFEKFLTTVMPIPEAELKRFKAAYPDAKK